MTRPMLLRKCVVAALVAATAHVAAQTGPRDDRGTIVTGVSPARRIVTLLPSLTETVCALGACDRLVGTDRYSNWPAQVVALPKLGGLDDAQVERIVALKPDLVLAAASARVTERLGALGLRVVVLEPHDRAEVRRSLDVVATLVGDPAAAPRLWATVERETAAAARRVPSSLQGKRVYFEVDASPYAAGESSFIGETLAQLGLGNIVPAALGPFPKLNPEFVVRSQPDLVIATGTELRTMARRPGWSSLRALQTGQTCGFEPSRYELLLRPGPRLGEAAGLLADCLVAMAARQGGVKP